MVVPPAFRTLLPLLPLFLQPAPAGDPTPDPIGDAEPHRLRKPKGITPEIQDWVNGIVAKEIRDARAKALAEAELTMMQATETATREQQSQRDAFETVRQELENARDAALAERNGLHTEYESLKGLFDADYEAALTTFPDVIRIFAPEPDATVAEKASWLAKAKTQATELVRLTPGGARPMPRPGDGAGEVKNPLSKRALLN